MGWSIIGKRAFLGQRFREGNKTYYLSLHNINKRMGGIYIHIPYCRKACTYCNFHFSTSMDNRSEMVAAIVQEIRNRKPYFEEASSIYFGGGTPSVLSESEIDQIFQALKDSYIWAENIEITFEANPDDINEEYLLMLRSKGINRLSLGVQSFFDDDLFFMNRSHNADQALKCIEDVKGAGILQINIDLIYGGPHTTDDMWKENIRQFLALDISHLSAYCLTVEPKTALQKLVNTNKVALDDEKAFRHFEILTDTLAQNNYEQYEISNFCKNGHYAKHNTSYWQAAKYMGYGPSAHSYNGKERSWNFSNNVKYIAALKKNEPYSEKEVLTEKDRYNEYVMTGLRTMWGINKEALLKLFGTEMTSFFKEELSQSSYRAMIEETEEAYYISKEGKFFSDAIAASLFKI